MRYYCAFFTLCLSFSFSFKGISRVVTFLALFNFQDAVSLTAFWAVQLFYYIITSCFCQVLFSSFFKKLSRLCFPLCRPSDSSSIISHLFGVVNPFFKISFKKFFWCVFLDFCVALSDKYYYITGLAICQEEDCPNLIVLFVHFHFQT